MPATRYAKSGDVNIAYQVVGDGLVDLVYVPGFVSNIELMWEDPGFTRFFDRLASFARLVIFDKRGTGLSDAVPLEHLPTQPQPEIVVGLAGILWIESMNLHPLRLFCRGGANETTEAPSINRHL